MAEETLTVPSGTQAPPTFVRHPHLAEKEGRAAKFHKAFQELTHEEVKPKEETEEKPVEKTVAEKPVETPKTEPVVEKPAEKAPEKPASPLDVLTSETKEIPEPDALKDIPKEIEGNEKQKANWGKLRSAADTGWAKVRELEAKLSEVEKAPKADPSLLQEHETLKQRVAKQEEYLKAINAEYSEEFQSLVGKRDETLGKIAKRVKAYGVDADTLVNALVLPESKFRNDQIKEAMSQLDPEDKTRVAALIEKLEEHDEQIAEFRKDLPGKWNELTAKREAQMREQQESTIKTLESEFSKVVETLPSKNMTMKEVPEFDDWNAEIKAARETALRVLKPGGANFQESVEIAAKGARYDTLEKRYLSLYKDYSEAQKRLKEIDSSGPDFKGQSKPEKAAAKSAPQKFREAMDAFKQGQLADV